MTSRSCSSGKRRLGCPCSIAVAAQFLCPKLHSAQLSVVLSSFPSEQLVANGKCFPANRSRVLFALPKSWSGYNAKRYTIPEKISLTPVFLKMNIPATAQQRELGDP